MRRGPKGPKQAFGKRLRNSLAQTNSRFIAPVRCGHSGTRGGRKHSEVAAHTYSSWCRTGPKETDRPTCVTPERSILNRLTDQFPDEIECTKPCVIISCMKRHRERSERTWAWVGCTRRVHGPLPKASAGLCPSPTAAAFPLPLPGRPHATDHSGRARPLWPVRYRTHAMHGPAHAALRRRRMGPIAWCVVSFT